MFSPGQMGGKSSAPLSLYMLEDMYVGSVIVADKGSNAYYPPHTHGGLTTHLIRRGTFTITYPDDNAKLHNGEVKKETFGTGARIDVPAGKRHEVWIGDEGCEYVIGE